jgi:hypothetical protein
MPQMNADGISRRWTQMDADKTLNLGACLGVTQRPGAIEAAVLATIQNDICVHLRHLRPTA